MSRTSRRTAAAVLFTAIAVAAPVAPAATNPNPDAFERAAIRAGVSGAPDAFERAVLRTQAASTVRPDDRSAARGPGSLVATALYAPAPDVDSGVAWDYVLAGAAGTAALCLVALAGFGLARQHRRLAPH